MKRSLQIGGLVVLATLSGCASPYNDRATLGRDDVTLEAIADPGPVYGPIVDDEELTLDRANWEWVVYEVPVDGTMHNPTWRWWNGHNNENARDRGEYPTAQTALILKGNDSGAEAGEGFSTPFVAFAEAVAMPVMAFVDNQWNGSWSPKWSYDRSSTVSHEAGAEFVEAPMESPPVLELTDEPIDPVKIEWR